MSSLVAIVGKKRSGKDTIGQILCNEYGYVRYAFADPLKDVCKILFDLTDEQLYGNEKEVIDPKWGVTPRILMQTFGTEIMRKEMNKYVESIDESFWINKFRDYYEKNLDKKIVISDCRMYNEAELVRNLGGKLIMVKRENIDIADNHESEQINIPEEWCTIINNDGSIEDLIEIVKNIMK